MNEIFCITICYIIASFLVSLSEYGIFKIFKINFKNISSRMQSSFILFCLFSHISIILSIVYALHQPDFIKFCLSHNEFCISWTVQEKIVQFEITDIVFLSFISLLLLNRIIKTFKQKLPENGLISPLIYKEKLEKCLTKNEIINLQVHDTDEIYAYCQGFLIPKIHLSKGIIEFLSSEKLDIVILHEKAHIKRMDLFYTFMFKIIAVFEIYPNQTNNYFKQWRREKEKACDDEVTKKYSPLLVAQTIIDVALKTDKKTNNMVLNFAGNQIIERVERLTYYQNNKKENSYIFIFLWMFLISIVILLINFSIIHCSIDKFVLLLLNNLF